MALRTVICLGWMLTPACAGPFHELVLNGGCSWSGPAINWTAPEGYAVALTGTDVLTDFFTFDLTGYSGTATSGTLRLTRYWTGGPPLFSYTLSDVNAVLWGTGDTYGFATAENPGSPGEVLVIALNAEALADINASRGRQRWTGCRQLNRSNVAQMRCPPKAPSSRNRDWPGRSKSRCTRPAPVVVRFHRRAERGMEPAGMVLPGSALNEP